VEKKAIQVWGSLENIEEQLELREENRAKSKIQKYSKKMKSLRMTARSSLYTRDLEPHQHTWGPDVCVDDEEDSYSHTCTVCGVEETFEKM
jgi:DNA-repair protein complementing XP-A cells